MLVCVKINTETPYESKVLIGTGTVGVTSIRNKIHNNTFPRSLGHFTPLYFKVNRVSPTQMKTLWVHFKNTARKNDLMKFSAKLMTDWSKTKGADINQNWCPTFRTRTLEPEPMEPRSSIRSTADCRTDIDLDVGVTNIRARILQWMSVVVRIIPHGHP